MNDFPAHKEKCGRKHKTANLMISLAYHTPDCIVTLSLDSHKAHRRTASTLTGAGGREPPLCLLPRLLAHSREEATITPSKKATYSF